VKAIRLYSPQQPRLHDGCNQSPSLFRAECDVTVRGRKGLRQKTLRSFARRFFMTIAPLGLGIDIQPTKGSRPWLLTTAASRLNTNARSHCVGARQPSIYSPLRSHNSPLLSRNAAPVHHEERQPLVHFSVGHGTPYLTNQTHRHTLHQLPSRNAAPVNSEGRQPWNIDPSTTLSPNRGDSNITYQRRTRPTNPTRVSEGTSSTTLSSISDAFPTRTSNSARTSLADCQHPKYLSSLQPGDFARSQLFFLLESAARFPKNKLRQTGRVRSDTADGPTVLRCQRKGTWRSWPIPAN